LTSRGSHPRFPDAADLPSVERAKPDPLDRIPSISTVLGKFIEDNNAIMVCPSDVGSNQNNDNPGNKIYSLPENEGLSYEYARGTLVDSSQPIDPKNHPAGLCRGRTREEVLNPVNRITGAPSPTLKSSVVKIGNDFLSFHGNAQSAGSQNIVFLDCHVEAPSPTASN
jgi:hypothetical protein